MTTVTMGTVPSIFTDIILCYKEKRHNKKARILNINGMLYHNISQFTMHIK